MFLCLDLGPSVCFLHHISSYLLCQAFSSPIHYTGEIVELQVVAPRGERRRTGHPSSCPPTTRSHTSGHRARPRRLPGVEPARPTAWARPLRRPWILRVGQGRGSLDAWRPGTRVGGEVRQPGCGGWSSLTRARHMGFASQVVGVEPARPRVWSRSSGASHRIRTTALESIHFSPTAFLRFLSFSIRVRTLFPPWETISIVSPLFPHLLAVMSPFLLMWLLIY
jgi:hypothetical protein